MQLQAQADADDLLSAAALASDRLLAALGHAAPAGGDAAALALEKRLQRVRAAFLANELDTARRILEDAPPSQLAAHSGHVSCGRASASGPTDSTCAARLSSRYTVTPLHPSPKASR